MSENGDRPELPEGWEWKTLGEVADSRLGKMLDKAKNVGQLRPYLRNINVQWGRFDLDDIKEMRITDREIDRYAVREGDLLICEGGEPGRCAVWRDPREMYFQKALHRVRPHSTVSADYLLNYLRYAAQTGQLEPFFTGTTIKHLPGVKLATLPVIVPPREEQDFVVQAIEQALTGIDAGLTALRTAERNLDQLATALVEKSLASAPGEDDSAQDSEWRWVSPPDIASPVDYALAIGPFGSNLKVSDYADNGVPLVFVRNIRSGVFDGSDTRFVMPEKARELAAHRIQTGDVLVTKMGDPPGDSAIYPPGLPDGIITADCIRFAVDRRQALPEYIALLFRSATVKRQVRERTKGVAQKKISLATFKSIRLPVPSLMRQESIVREAEELDATRKDLEATVNGTRVRAADLRRSALHSAFSGELRRGMSGVLTESSPRSRAAS